jgi:hypothetical protein
VIGWIQILAAIWRKNTFRKIKTEAYKSGPGLTEIITGRHRAAA